MQVAPLRLLCGQHGQGGRSLWLLSWLAAHVHKRSAFTTGLLRGRRLLGPCLAACCYLFVVVRAPGGRCPSNGHSSTGGSAGLCLQLRGFGGQFWSALIPRLPGLGGLGPGPEASAQGSDPVRVPDGLPLQALTAAKRRKRVIVFVLRHHLLGGGKDAPAWVS